ncbi:CPBP family glutamic-type intramembrane protease [Lactobacillus sp. ESL0791]|uniref:CPBP family glutamic-type intramembrane protease n=1 Tax=Lactobacillus sp. ESL0791 TaxID=2983234 RepID=UPI0023FA07DA|nr:CPBP family glutamic-type intramembrane protease [Lactobacillus sp. ESL0791]MDF7639861.1 CPBP family glutamic-type intramembrane protease [Lactobacillus sp. ESL0791]
MLEEKNIRKWHLWQTIIQDAILLLCLFVGLMNKNLFSQRREWLMVLCLFLSCFEFVLLKPEGKYPAIWQKINHYLATASICYTLMCSLAAITQLLNFYHLINPTFWMLLIMLYSFVMYIPMAKLALQKIANNWGRIIVLSWIVFVFLVNSQVNIAGNLHYAKLLQIVINSGFTGVITTLIITSFVMRPWRINRPKFAFSCKAGWGTNSFIILIMTLELGFLLLGVLTQSHFSLPKINLASVFLGLRAGIGEEWVMRFMLISLFIQIFQNSKYRSFLVILCDGVFFGVWHLQNIFSQSPKATLVQMLQISGLGLLLAAAYLYTGSLLVPITFHGVYDFLLFIMHNEASNNGVFKSRMADPTAVQWLGTFVYVIFYVVITLIIVLGKRHQQVLNYNLEHDFL